MFFHVVSLSTSSSELRLRRNSMVTCECRSVNRKLEPTISGRCFFFVFQWDVVGVRRCVVRLFLGVSDASVVAVEGQFCVRGFGLSSFCEVVLGSWRFCLCIDDVV